MTRRASCCCGQLEVICTGEPIRVSVCHCHACQRRTGSVFGAQARFRLEQLSVQGERSEYTRTGDSGGKATFRFCPTCGSTVFWELDGLPGMAAVAVGAFADRDFPKPTVSVYEDRRHAWVVTDFAAEHYD
ncbi:MAG: GFA family protein [Deltaproteobacteria bacterium]|nr:GFA family protein [Deltaproteobacteria bacterium]